MPFQPVPPDPVLIGYEMSSAMQPCNGETVSGDGLFVEKRRDDGAVMLLLVDVAGHGEPTQLLRDCLVASLGDAVSENVSPGELLTRLNGSLQTPLLDAQDAADGLVRFVCALAVLLDHAIDVATGANAAIPPVQSQPPATPWEVWPCPNNPPLRLLAADSIVSANAPVPFVAGQRILAFTDGVTEAGTQGTAGAFAPTGLPAFLAALSLTAAPAAVVTELIAALQHHVGAAWPDDDTTIFCLRRM